MTEPIDEYLLQRLTDYKGTRLQSLAKDGVQFGDEDDRKAKEEELTEEFKELTAWLVKALSVYIDKAVVSTRLTKSPAAVLANAYGPTGNMERILAAQAM
jgi:heat shock protein 90kDa beta